MSIQLGLCSLNGLMIAAWKGVPGVDAISFVQYDSGNIDGTWALLGVLPGGSSVGPSLANRGGNTLFAAWKGPDRIGEGLNNLGLYFSQLTLPADVAYGQIPGDLTWSSPIAIPRATSHFGPALVAYGSFVVAAWAGTSADLEFSGEYPVWCMTATAAEGTGVVSSFSGPVTRIPGASSSFGVSLAISDFDSQIYAAWPVAGSNNKVELATGQIDLQGAIVWTMRGEIPGIQSSTGPSLSSTATTPDGNYGAMWAAWTDAMTGEVYCNSLDDLFGGVNPTPIRFASPGPAPTSSDRPTLAASPTGNSLFALWKGAGIDEQIYCATMTGDAPPWTEISPVAFSTGSDPVGFRKLPGL